MKGELTVVFIHTGRVLSLLHDFLRRKGVPVALSPSKGTFLVEIFDRGGGGSAEDVRRAKMRQFRRRVEVTTKRDESPNSHHNSSNVLSVLQSRLEDTNSSVDGWLDHLGGIIGIHVNRRRLNAKERVAGAGSSSCSFFLPSQNTGK